MRTGSWKKYSYKYIFSQIGEICRNWISNSFRVQPNQSEPEVLACIFIIWFSLSNIQLSRTSDSLISWNSSVHLSTFLFWIWQRLLRRKGPHQQASGRTESPTNRRARRRQEGQSGTRRPDPRQATSGKESTYYRIHGRRNRGRVQVYRFRS